MLSHTLLVKHDILLLEIFNVSLFRNINKKLYST